MTDTAADQALAGALDAGSPSRVEEADARDFLALLKPRVVSLVVFTGFVGMWLAPGPIHPLLAFVAVLCIAVGAGAAGAINMWWERDIDAMMARTRMRPIPMGRVSPDAAIAFALILSGLSVALLGLALNWVAAAMLAGTIFYYGVIYTVWLKRSTAQNIVIGGASGAFPPLIGWAAVTGGVDVLPVILFALIFLWTPPHFWALALYRSEDYRRAGVPMLPVTAGAAFTRWQMLGYTLILPPFALAPWALGAAGATYAIVALALSFLFIAAAVAVLVRRDEASARRMFGFSVLYLFLLFAMLIVDGGASLR